MPFFDGGHSGGGSRSTTTAFTPPGLGPGMIPRTGPLGNQLPTPFSGPLGQVGSQQGTPLQPTSNWASGALGATEDPLKRQQQTGGMSAGV